MMPNTRLVSIASPGASIHSPAYPNALSRQPILMVPITPTRRQTVLQNAATGSLRINRQTPPTA